MYLIVEEKCGLKKHIQSAQIQVNKDEHNIQVLL